MTVCVLIRPCQDSFIGKSKATPINLDGTTHGKNGENSKRKGYEKMKVKLTLKQSSKVNRLIKKLCANYCDGYCLLLDDGEPCQCVQALLQSYVGCRYFLSAVLPADKALLEEILLKDKGKRCQACGKSFIPKSNRQKYCESCGKKIRREQKTQSERKRRVGVKC